MTARSNGRTRRKIFARLVARDGAFCCVCRTPHRPIWRRGRVYSGITGTATGRFTEVYLTSNLDIEHIIPVSQGGTNALANLQLMCIACHNAKTASEKRSRSRGPS